MEEARPSRTAENAAIMRALHQRLPEGTRVLDDPIATRLVDPESEPYQSRVKFVAGLPESLRSRFTHYVLRSRYAEDCLAASGLPQYVLLGAGLDTFAYRQPPYAEQMQIFEVDHPATQGWKQERLAGAGIIPPGNVRFAAVDFNKVSLANGLADVGFDPSLPTFFSMLGVAQYLTFEALDDTLGYVARCPRSSEIVFSFVVPQRHLPREDAEYVASFVEHAAAIGEPWLTRCDPAELREHLVGIGFSTSTHLTPAEADARYYAGRGHGLHAPEIEQMMRAVV